MTFQILILFCNYDLTMEAQSTLYWLVCKYTYAATCVYKTVCIVDIIDGIFSLLNALMFLSITNFRGIHGWIMALASLFVAYIGVLALMLLIKFGDNLSTSNIHPPTEEFLKLRIYKVYLWFALAIIIPCIMAGYFLYYSAPVPWAGFIFFVINYLLVGITHFFFQKSLAEANDVLGGTTSSLQKNQVL